MRFDIKRNAVKIKRENFTSQNTFDFVLMKRAKHSNAQDLYSISFIHRYWNWLSIIFSEHAAKHIPIHINIHSLTHTHTHCTHPDNIWNNWLWVMCVCVCVEFDFLCIWRVCVLDLYVFNEKYPPNRKWAFSVSLKWVNDFGCLDHDVFSKWKCVFIRCTAAEWLRYIRYI